MNAIISNGDYTAFVQLPVDRRQLAGALSYLGKNHASAYDIKYNEESDQGLSFTLDCRGIVENAIAKAIPTGFRFHTLNDTIALMHNLPYQSRREFENTVKVEGLASYEQLDRMLTEAYPQSVTTKYYCPLTIQVHGTNSWGEVDEDGYEEDAAFAAVTRTRSESNSWRTMLVMKTTWLNTSTETMACPKSYVLPNGASSVETASSTDASPYRQSAHSQRTRNRISRSGSPDRTRTALAKDSSRERSTSRVDIVGLSCT